MERLEIYRNQNEYKNELKRLEKASISQENKETIRAFMTFLRSRDAGDCRVVKLSWQLRRIAEILGKNFNEVTKTDIERLVAGINQGNCVVSFKRGKPLSPWTKADYCRVIKQFYKWLKGTKQPPEEVDWIKCRVSNKDKNPNFNLITWDDINKCKNIADSPKDLAFITFLYESGARIGEVLNMRVSDVLFKEKYARVRLNGKTGERWIVVVNCVQYLAQYLNRHNNRTDEKAFFWLSDSLKNKNSPLRYAGAVMLVRKLFKKASINKRCNPHSFRHSKATEFAKTLTEPQLRMYFGWEKGSDTPSVYTHLSGRDIDNAVLTLNGLQDRKEEQKARPITCSICETTNNPGSLFCSKCGYGLSVKAVLDTEDKKKIELENTFKLLMEISRDQTKMAEFEKFVADNKVPQ